MTHLGLGSSLEEPWGCLAGGGGGVIAFPGGSMNLLGGLGGPLPWGLLATLPRIVCWIVRLTCLGVREVRRSPVFRWRQESRRLGGKGVGGVLAWGRLASSPGGVGWEGRGVRGVLAWKRLASSPGEVGWEGRGVRGGYWPGKGLASSPGGVAPAWGRVLSSPAWLLACKGGWRGVSLSMGGDLPGKTCCLPQGVPGRLPDCYLGNYSCGYGYDYSNLD